MTIRKNKLLSAGRVIAKAIAQANIETADAIVARVQTGPGVPEDTGDMRSTARREDGTGTGQIVIVGGAVGSGTGDGGGQFVDYAEYVDEDHPFFDAIVAAERPAQRDRLLAALKAQFV